MFGFSRLRKFLGEPFIIAVVVAILYAIFHITVGEAAFNLPIPTLVAIAFLLLLIIFAAVREIYDKAVQHTCDVRDPILTKLDGLLDRMPQFSYYAAEDGRDLLFLTCDRIAKKAKKEILALNWHNEERMEDSATRTKYFDTLIERSKNVHYRRVLQAETFFNRTKPLSTIFQDDYMKHFKAMVTECGRRRENPTGHFIELFIAPPTIPSTFLIVDEAHLVWELVEIEDPKNWQTSRWKMRGLIEVHDERFVQHFKTTFENVLAASIRNVEPGDLI